MTGFHGKNGCGVRVYMGLMGRNMPVSTRWLLRGLLTQGNRVLRNSCVSVNPFQPASQPKHFFPRMNWSIPPSLNTRLYATQTGEDPNKSVNEQKPVWLDLLLKLLEEQHRSTQQAIENLKESQTLQFAQVNKRIDDVNTHVNYLLNLVVLGIAGSGLYLGYRQLLLSEHDQARNKTFSGLKSTHSETESDSGLPAKVAGEQLMDLSSAH